MEFENQFKFFVVDDDGFCRNMYHHYLTELGYKNVSLYADGKDCLNNIEQNPDIIFLDHNMEDITGFEVLIKIKRFNPNIYVIMVSAQENMKTAIDSLKYGAFDYIIKDEKVNERMKTVIEKVIFVKEELKKSKPTIIQRLLHYF